jgi:hypothetical protein
MFPLRLLRTARSEAPATRVRLEVCPPSLFDAPDTVFRRWMRRMGGEPRNADGAARLQAAREDFVAALADIGTQHAEFLIHGIQRKRSLRDLWHLRPEIYGLIAVQRSESEADRRIERLNRHFPTRSPGSGFGTLAH